MQNIFDDQLLMRNYQQLINAWLSASLNVNWEEHLGLDIYPNESFGIHLCPNNFLVSTFTLTIIRYLYIITLTT